MLAVVALISFVFTLNEFVIASALLQTTDHFTLPVGMNQLVNNQYDQTWGPFTAGALMAAVPVVILFLFLQRWIVSGLTAGRGQGMTRSCASTPRRACSTEPHHDGSELYVSGGAYPGERATVRLRAPRGLAERVVLRTVHDGEASVAEAAAVRRRASRRRGGRRSSR